MPTDWPQSSNDQKLTVHSSNANIYRGLQKGRDPEFAKLLEDSEKALATKKNGGKRGNARTRKSEKQEDAELIAEEVQEGEDDTFVFTESPACE